MSKHTLLRICFLLAGSVLGVYALSVFALYAGKTLNGFSRTFTERQVLIPSDTIDLGFDSYYVAGHTNRTLYLGSVVAPRHVLSLSVPDLDSQHFQLRIPEPRSLRISSIQVAVDSPNVFLCEGTSPVIYKGYLSQSEVWPIETRGTYFLDVVPAGPAVFAIRVLNTRRENALAFLSLEPFDATSIPIDLEKQVDGFFCTNGKLHYDRTTKTIVYVYRYRNQYIKIDSLLGVERGKTIDTVSRADIQVATISSSETKTLSKPAKIVNRLSAMHGRYLFVNSDLIADNESSERFQNANVIDVYDLHKMQYGYSFYIPNLKGSSLRDFVVFDGHLVALYERKLVVFKTYLDILHR